MFAKKLGTLSAAFFLGLLAQAQDTVHYSGTTLSRVDYHHGQLPAAVGVHNIQVMRANREQPATADGFGWTYNHAPNLAYWKGRFYVHYLSNPVGEHVPPGQTLLVTSSDGYNWSKPVLLFPPVKIPDGYQKPGYPGTAKDLYAVMHQRMGFYVAGSGRMLALGYYGIAMDAKDDPNDGKGMGRVVREVLADGSFGPIYFIRPNKTWDLTRSDFKLYTTSKDKGFVAACNELMATPLMMQQWVEEADRDDPLVPLKKELKAFSYYHLADGRVVGLWKHALTSVSDNDGRTWKYSPLRAPRFVNSNAKIWGQRTSNGRFATVYNPSEFRWPLAVSTSVDGLNYTDLMLVNGEITSMRYGGNYKSYGPQYVRGIEEGNGVPADGRMWVTYSMNKEDIWVASIAVPIVDTVVTHANENFSAQPGANALAKWNTYSPVWARVGIDTLAGSQALVLRDRDPFDYARAERVVPASKKVVVEFSVVAAQNDKGMLDIEFVDAKGNPAIRLTLDSTGTLLTKAGYRSKSLGKYASGQQLTLKVDIDSDRRFYTVGVNGKAGNGNIFFAPVDRIQRVVFRTGSVRRFPDADTPTDQGYDLPNAGASVPEARFGITSFKTYNP